MAGYGTARSLARRLGEDQTAEILQQTLDEEGEANKKLTSIAESEVNVAASIGLAYNKRRAWRKSTRPL